MYIDIIILIIISSSQTFIILLSFKVWCEGLPEVVRLHPDG